MITVTEALAEIKTIEKRIAKKRQFVLNYLFLQGNIKDPLEAEGGSRKTIEEARQSISDLENRIISIRTAISTANAENAIKIAGVKRTIADWLIWKREIAAGYGSFLEQMRGNVANVRKQAGEKNFTIVEEDAKNVSEVTIYIKEKQLSDQIEAHEETLGALDGQLSLKNATIKIKV